jgi:RNA polymerase sigma factor (sigma-70 family)
MTLTTGSGQENTIMTAATAYAPCAPARQEADQPRDDSLAIDLVARARDGEIQAWNALVEQYDPLIASICRKYRLGRADTDDVSQSVWLRLVDQLDKIRQPAALPGWLATTARRECGRVVRAAQGPHAVIYALDAENLPDARAQAAEQELLAAERRAAVREALSALPPACQRLVAELTADPPLPYAEVSARLGIPVGSIGPTRSRCLDRMRRYPAIAALIDSESGSSRPVLAAASLPVAGSGPEPVMNASSLVFQGWTDDLD